MEQPKNYGSWREVAVIALCQAAPEFDEKDDHIIYGSAFRRGVADLARELAETEAVEIVDDDGGRNVKFKVNQSAG